MLPFCCQLPCPCPVCTEPVEVRFSKGHPPLSAIALANADAPFVGALLRVRRSLGEGGCRARPFSVDSPIPYHCRRDAFSRLPSAVTVQLPYCCCWAAIVLLWDRLQPLTNDSPLTTTYSLLIPLFLLSPPPTSLFSTHCEKIIVMCGAY